VEGKEWDYTITTFSYLFFRITYHVVYDSGLGLG
jgi:hypothetical protein